MDGESYMNMFHLREPSGSIVANRLNRLPRVVVQGTGSSLPSHLVHNDDFSATLDTSDEWISSRTGFSERRFIGNEETSNTLALEASKRALQSAQIDAEELDLILVATISPETTTPTIGNVLQHELKCRTIPSMDISAACTGFLYSMFLGTQTILAGGAQNVLVVGVEVMSRIIDFKDRNTCILFGDGAGAIVLSAHRPENKLDLRSMKSNSNSREANEEWNTGSADPNLLGIHQFHLFSDGSKSHLIRVPNLAGDFRGPNSPHAGIPGFVEMNGREVFKFAVNKLTELLAQGIKDAERLGLTIDYLVPHQVNIRIINMALEMSGFPTEKVILNLKSYANTSAASVPIALDEALRLKRILPGSTILLVAFGGGLTWGSALVSV